MALSFRTRVLAALVFVIAGVLIPIFVVVYSAIRASMIEHAQVSLETGARVFGESMRERDAQLLYAARQAASDFGFKEAVATEDVPTIRSALENYNKRLGARESLVLSLDGNVVVSTFNLPDDEMRRVLSQLVHDAENKQFELATLVVGGAPHQLVAVPVEAPERIAWAVMGFVLDDALAAKLKALTGLEISFVGYGRRDRNADTASLTSTLAAPLRDALASTLRTRDEVSEPYAMQLRDAEYLTREIPVDAGRQHEVGAVLQMPLQQGGPFRALGNRLALISALALGVALVTAVILAHGVARPLNRLVAATQRIALGDYRHKVEIRRKDELGALATSLNTMQKAIAEREDKIAHQAFHDTLTGLPNRALAHDRLQSAIERARRNGNAVGVLMIDVDRFKEINDTLGHHTGDQLLIELGRRLQATVRASDTVARLGGDEFLTLVEGQNLDAALLVGAKLKAVTAEPMKLGTVEVVTELSIGVSVYPDHGDDAEALLRRADIAMYEAKSARSSPAAYRPGREEEHLHRLALVNDLRRAAPNNELVVHYQPKIELGTRAVTHVEALMRWRHPRYGMVRPDEFIPLAEQSGHIRALTHWLLDTVVRECSVWRREGIDVGVAINISVTDLTSMDLPAMVEGRLREHGLDARYLTLEVTESSVMRDAANIILMLERLNECGVRLSIDDFGTGYSSLSHLKRLPVHELKIDKSFVLDLMNSTSDAVIVKSTIDLGHNMGLRVVAEGVENEESLKLLQAYRCDMAQGFIISKPLPLAEFIEWFKQYKQTPAAGAPLAAETTRIKII